MRGGYGDGGTMTTSFTKEACVSAFEAVTASRETYRQSSAESHFAVDSRKTKLIFQFVEDARLREVSPLRTSASATGQYLWCKRSSAQPVDIGGANTLSKCDFVVLTLISRCDLVVQTLISATPWANAHRRDWS